jgi:hypothetical protein
MNYEYSPLFCCLSCRTESDSIDSRPLLRWIDIHSSIHPLSIHSLESGKSKNGNDQTGGPRRLPAFLDSPWLVSIEHGIFNIPNDKAERTK